MQPSNYFILPHATELCLYDIPGMEDPLDKSCERLHLIQPNFISKEYKIPKAHGKMSLIISGDGDYPLTSNSIDFITSLKEAGRKIDIFILNDLEVEHQTLKETLELIKGELNSFRLKRIALDKAHIEILNETKLNLKHLSLANILPDNQSIFDEKNSGKNTSIDLNLTNLGSEMEYLHLDGIPISQEIREGIENSKALKHLLLENLVGNKNQNLDFIKSIFADMYRFPKLQTLSLAGNNLSSIDFTNLQENSKKPIFPPTLRKLNLNSTSLNDKSLQGLIKIIGSSEAKLNALSLSKCSADLKTIKDLEEYKKSTQNPDFQYQPPVQCLGTEANPNVLDELNEDNNSENKIATIKTQEERIRTEKLQSLTKYSKEQKIFIEESRKQKNPTGLASIAKLTTASQYLPIILKDAAGIKSFLNACQFDVIDFARDPKSLIPKNDFSLAPKYAKMQLDKTAEIGGEELIGEHQIPFIRQVHLERVSDEKFAEESMEVQRERFLPFMEALGYRSTEVELPDGREDVFVVMIDDSQYIGWDYRIAVFSIIWRPQYHTVSVKFNLSDDCFMKRKDRTNVYKVSNQDYLIDILSTLNLKPLDFVGELDVLADGETEVNIRCNIMKYGSLNLAKLLLVTIDKGFIFLRVLQEKNIFDHEDSSAVEEDARQIRKAVKAELKVYAESEEFLAFSKADNEKVPEESN